MQTTRKTRTGVLVLGAAGTLLLAGCSGGGGDGAPVVPTVTPASRTVAAPAPSTAAAASSTGEETGTPGGGATRSPSQGCTPDGTGVPAGAVSSPTIDVDGDGRPDTQWIQTDADGRVLLGITTASGSTFGARFASGSPIAKSVLVADATGAGEIVALASDGRQANLFVVDGCHLTPATNARGGQYTFDLGFGSYGTGVGCSTVAGASGRGLVGLKLNLDPTRSTAVSVDRTAVELDGTRATNGPSDSVDVRGRGPADPAVLTAQEVTCGTRTLAADGVQQPR